MPQKLRTSLRWMLAAAALSLAAPLPAASGAVLGGLTELAGPAGCVTSDGNLGLLTNVCTAAPEVGTVMSVAISPDGRFAYVNGRTTALNIAILSRDPASGALSPIAGTDFCLSLDGSGNGGAAACTDVRLLGHSDEGDSLAMTRDGSFLYVGGTDGIAVFRRDAATGKLTQLDGTDGCLSVDGNDENGAATCTDARRLSNVHTITLSRDERFAYANAQGDARRRFRRRDLLARRDHRQADATPGHRRLRDLQRRQRGRRRNVPGHPRRRLRERVRHHAG